MDGSLPAVWGLLDWRGEHTPDDPWMTYPTSDSGSPEESASLTFSDGALASHRVAYGLRMARVSDQEGLVVAVLLNTDALHYALLLTGMMRAGMIPLPLSNKTPPETMCKVLQSLNCHHILTQGTACMHLLVSTVKSLSATQHYALRIDEVPDLNFVLPRLKNKDARKSINVGPYPTNGRKPSPSDVVLYLQSPLSSRFHHTIPLTNQTIMSWQRRVTRTSRSRDRMLPVISAPIYDTTGILLQVFIPLTTGIPIAVFPPKAPARPVLPTPQNTLELVRTLRCTGIITTVAFMEQWANDEEAMQTLSQMMFVNYTGASCLPPYAEAAFSSFGIRFAPAQDGCLAYHAGVRGCSDEWFKDLDPLKLSPAETNPLIVALQRHSTGSGIMQ